MAADYGRRPAARPVAESIVGTYRTRVTRRFRKWGATRACLNPLFSLARRHPEFGQKTGKISYRIEINFT